MNSQNVGDQIRELIALHRPHVVVIDMSRVPDIEYSALQMLIEAERRAPSRGHELWLAGLNPGVLEVVCRSGLAERLGRERMLFNTRLAIERYQKLQAEALARPAGA